MEGQESVFGVIVAVLAVDSRESGGNEAASGEPFEVLDDLSMFASIQGFQDREGEEWRLVSADGTCQGLS